MIKFYEKRNWFFAFSALLILIGIVGFLINGLSLDIQFKGGSIIKYTYTSVNEATDNVFKDQAATVATNALGKNVTTLIVKSIADPTTKKIVFNIAGNEGLSSQDQQTLDTALKTEFVTENLAFSESSNVEPFMGKKFLKDSFWAISIASLLIVLYVWWRFKKISGLSAGVMALVALLHDATMVLITFIVFKIPLNDAFVAVILTIIGYSINDTIVIYDRIRENSRNASPKTPIEDITNTSITQSLSRSINTNVATFISITIVYIFALVYNLESIKNFALPMMVGVLTGCYSTIFIAGPLWVMWQKFKVKRKEAILKK